MDSGIEDVYLKLGRFHSDGDTDQDDAGHGDGRIALPVHWPTVWSTRHAPNLRPEISAVRSICVVVVISSAAAHFAVNRVCWSVESDSISQLFAFCRLEMNLLL